MEENIQEKVIAPEEEKRQEEELLKETPADEIRKSIVEKYNLDADTDNELIDKLVAETDTQQKTLSKAIKQKRSWREKAEAQTERKTEDKPKASEAPEKPKPEEKDIDKILDQKFEDKELEAIDIGDEAKKELKAYAQATGLKIKDVVKSDYFKFLKEKEEAQKRTEEASIGGKRGAPSRKEFSLANPPTPDMSTEEGRKEWEDYKKWRKTQ